MNSRSLPAFVRNAPQIFLYVAVADFIKNIAPLIQYSVSGYSSHIRVDDDGNIRVQLLLIAVAGAVYAMQWVAYAAFAHLLIAILDNKPVLTQPDVAEVVNDDGAPADA